MKFILHIAAACLILAGCGSNLDLSGKGARASCLYLDTDSLKVIDACGGQSLSMLRVYVNIDSKHHDGRLLCKLDWDEPVKQFILPLPEDSLVNRHIQVDLYPEGAAHRDMYWIDLRPGDLDRKKRIIARFFGH